MKTLAQKKDNKISDVRKSMGIKLKGHSSFRQPHVFCDGKLPSPDFRKERHNKNKRRRARK